MGLLDLFKSKPKKKVFSLHQVQLKSICRNKDDLYIGKICKIVTDIGKNDEEIFYLETYEGKKVGNFKIEDYNYCANYNYAIINDITEKEIYVCIICANVYPISLKIKTNIDIKNGDVLKIINAGDLLDPDKNNIVGKVVDDRLPTLNLENIALSQIDDSKLLTLIYK